MNTKGEFFAYADSSAIAKLFQPEAESAALRGFLSGCFRVSSSVVARVEVLRVAGRQGAATVAAAEAALDGIALVELNAEIIDTAAALPPTILRSLDAIHLATAIALGHQLDVVVTYDVRMQEAARGLGLTVAAPA